jgi:formamidopyrimidine-DNA glycosylase
VPELPDLLHIVAALRERLLGRHVSAERVKEPVVLRFAVRGNLSLLLGRTLADLFRKSHFLVFRFEGLDLAVNPMLAGRFRIAAPGEKDEAALAFALTFDLGAEGLAPGSAAARTELRYVDASSPRTIGGPCRECRRAASTSCRRSSPGSAS